MNTTNQLQERISAVAKMAAFNNWLGFDVVAVEPGEVTLRLDWRPELGQYSGFLHAAIIGGLIDTACGFAAGTLSGNVLASQFAVRCLRPAVGEHFTVIGRVVKPGKQQVFASAELHAFRDGKNTLVAVGDALLVPQSDNQK